MSNTKFIIINLKGAIINRITIVYIVLVFFSLSQFSCSSHYYSKEEAVRSLKVLNSDLVNLLTVSSEMDEMKVLKFLYDQTDAPIPFKKSHYSINEPAYEFDSLKGTYIWNSENAVFKHIKDKEFIDIKLNLNDVDSDSFQLLSYESEPYSSKPDFPTKLIAKIFEGNKETMTIMHVARVKDKLPEYMKTTIKGEDFDIEMGFERTRQSNDGTIELYCTLKKGIYTVVDLNILAEISYSKQGFYYNTIEFDSEIFNHSIVGEIDYKNINPTAKNYSESFNKNAKIQIYESHNNKVGDIVLANTGNNDLQEFQIKFKNKDEVLLKEYLPALNKLYNIKY